VNWPFDVVFSPAGDLLVSELYAHLGVLRFDGRSGTFLEAFVPPGRGGLLNSSGLTFGPDNNLYVGSPATDSVLRYDGRRGDFLGEFVTQRSGGLQAPRGLRFGPDGQLYVSSAENHAVLRYDGKTGAFIDEFISPGGGGLDNGPNFIAFTPPRARLEISLSSDGPKVSWSVPGSDAVVEASVSVAGPWKQIATTSDTANGEMREQSVTAPMKFFRVRPR
jgi:DNA-binding beta-propeller fold protein YncE